MIESELYYLCCEFIDEPNTSDYFEKNGYIDPDYFDLIIIVKKIKLLDKNSGIYLIEEIIKNIFTTTMLKINMFIHCTLDDYGNCLIKEYNMDSNIISNVELFNDTFILIDKSKVKLFSESLENIFRELCKKYNNGIINEILQSLSKTDVSKPQYNR